MLDVPTPRIALATCADLPRLDRDDRLLDRPLRSCGAIPEPKIWNDVDVDWEAFDLVVVRSTWDYPPCREAYLAWAARVPRLANPYPLIDWSTDKHYLEDLMAAGVPTVSTRYLQDVADLGSIEGEYVIKPTVSASSVDAARYGPGDEKQASEHIATILRDGKTPMVQPYLAAVDQLGETGLVFFEGEYSHAVRKSQILHRGAGTNRELNPREPVRPREPRSEELCLAGQVVSWVARNLQAMPLYARIDLLPATSGPLVLEVELAEPSLFLQTAPTAAQRFASAILREAGFSHLDQLAPSAEPCGY